MQDERRLDELGERRIIEDILRPRYGWQESNRFGDDCAVVAEGGTLANGLVVATTDPCPEPMSSFLGYFDFYYRGWLLATINLSDLAAVGAKPLGLLTSLILRNDTTIGQLLRLLDGIDGCCAQSGTHTIGGNIKEGAKVELSATAIGICSNRKFLSRTGCHAGDLIVIIGDLGLFWSGVLAVQHQIPLEDKEKQLLKNVLTPMPKVRIGQELAEDELLTSCIDNSDGLYPSLIQLAEANGLQMYINMIDVIFPPEVLYVSSLLNLDPIRLTFGWGDWQLIGCCDPNKLNKLREVSQRYEVDVHVIGEVRKGKSVSLEHKQHTGQMAPVDSQRFTQDSWFTAGLQSYINVLVKGPLWKD
jgi:thiamine-monophosphate kinase